MSAKVIRNILAIVTLTNLHFDTNVAVLTETFKRYGQHLL